MAIHTVLDGNSFYEIDEECMEQRKKGRGAAAEAGSRTVKKQREQGHGAAAEAGSRTVKKQREQEHGAASAAGN